MQDYLGYEIEKKQCEKIIFLSHNYIKNMSNVTHTLTFSHPFPYSLRWLLKSLFVGSTQIIIFSNLVCREFCTPIHCICLWAFDISMKIGFLVQKTNKDAYQSQW
jgi:hypothetical protein